MNSGPATPKVAAGLRTAVRALAHRNFRLFFAGQTISLLPEVAAGIQSARELAEAPAD